MIELRYTVAIDVTPEVVWSWLEAMPDRYPEWHPDHLGARWVSGGAFLPGAVLGEGLGDAAIVTTAPRARSRPTPAANPTPSRRRWSGTAGVGLSVGSIIGASLTAASGILPLEPMLCRRSLKDAERRELARHPGPARTTRSM